ncbi:MAG: DUF4160 domain-containing protein [Thermodesulfobacteriota bacterium]
MSPKVGELEAIEISIKYGDHGNPHVHAWYQGRKVKIFIETLDVENGGVPPKQMKKLNKWIEESRESLLASWDEFVNSE